MVEFIIGVILAAAAVWFVLKPILLPGDGGRDAGVLDADDDDVEEDMSPRAVALRALREIEFDRETGKLSTTDYQDLHQKYTAEALAAMRAEGTGSEKREAGSVKTLAAPLPASRFPLPECSVHGRRPEPEAVFCSDCGRRLGKTPGYCARCGAALETEARYCNVCGSRVAA